MSVSIERFRDLSRRTQAGITAVVMTLAAAAPVLFAGSAGATPALLQRKLTSTSARPSQATQLTWTFNTTADSANIKKLEIEFCDNPLGACNTTLTPTLAGSPTVTLSNFTTNTLTGSPTVGGGRNGGSNNQINITKTNADAGASLTGAQIQLGASDITNNSTANKTYYTRLRLYSDSGTPPVTLVWEGVFAQSTSQTLTVNARVQERLDFCVGSTTVNDGTTSVGATCTNVSGSSVDIGNIDSGGVNVSPVSSTNGGDDKNGVAMIRTNAVNGASVAYHALGDTSSGTLKVPGATCVASPVSNTPTDQCFNTSTSKGAFTPGTEKFGMTIAAINPGSTSAYSCTFAAGDCNLVRSAGIYDSNGTNTYTTDTDVVSGTTNSGYAWDADPANTVTIASSTGSTIKVIDDEAMILKFAATSGITTPTGSYTVQADFIATTTF